MPGSEFFAPGRAHAYARLRTVGHAFTIHNKHCFHRQELRWDKIEHFLSRSDQKEVDGHARTAWPRPRISMESGTCTLPGLIVLYRDVPLPSFVVPGLHFNLHVTHQQIRSVRIAMAGWLHVVFVGEWLFVFPLCGFSLSLFCNYKYAKLLAIGRAGNDNARF